MSTAILSIDGGGMKGIITTIVLIRLEKYLSLYSERPNSRIGDYFDLIGGTSTGSIITALSIFPQNGYPKFSAQDIYDMYISMGEKIFVKQSLFPLFGPKYSKRGIITLMEEVFGDLTLNELLKPCIITAYDTATRSPTFFNSMTARKNASRNPLVRDAVISSCSAPTYFPPCCISTTPSCTNCFVDGGVVANNPALCALIEGLKLPSNKELSDVLLLSVGNIENQESFSYQEVRKWGLLEWALPLFSILLNTNDKTVDYQLRSIFHSIHHDENYLRMEATTKEKVPGMDDTSPEAIAFFVRAGIQLADDNDDKLRNFAKRLIKNKQKY